MTSLSKMVDKCRQEMTFLSPVDIHVLIWRKIQAENGRRPANFSRVYRLRWHMHKEINAGGNMKKTTVIESLINAQEAPAVIIDKHFRIVAANHAYCTSYGIDSDAIVGQYCHKVSHHSDEPCFHHGEACPLQTVLATKKPFEVLHVHYDYNNQPDRVRIKSYPIETANGDILTLETIHRLAPAIDLTCDDMRMVGKSPIFLQFVETLSLASKSNIPVVLYGETGVGKELATRFIHDQSPRKDNPYVELNCAAIPEALFESELFGHERGAFTGCVGLKKGMFELADTGSLFLDEIGELPLSMQAKLLRVLDSGEFRRIGGNHILKVDVRIIAATNKNLLAMVAEGKFREDLYFRLAGIKMDIPPLRERQADIPALAEILIKRICEKDKINQCHITQEAINLLVSHNFPGNVRELRNILQKAVALSEDGMITPAHIHLNQHCENVHSHSHSQQTVVNKSKTVTHRATSQSAGSLGDVEALHITELLERHSHNRSHVADALGISERTLYRKIKKYKIASKPAQISRPQGS